MYLVIILLHVYAFDGLPASEAGRRPAEVFDVDGRGRRRLDRFG
jgi:hypothetical protein